MVPNSYKVPENQWAKWNLYSRQVFNAVYCMMAYNQHLFKHPQDVETPLEYWQTTCWNAAWEAAEAVRDLEWEG